MSPPAQIKTVLVVVAMEAEAMPLVKALGLGEAQRIAPPAPCEAHSGQWHGMTVHVVCNGKDSTHGVDNVGTVGGALASFLAIQHLKPDVVISAGTCGGFAARGAAIADVFISTATLNHDRRIALPVFDEFGIGLIASHPCDKLAKALGLKQGVVSSGNSLDYTDKCMDMMTRHEAACKEMEAAAVAWVANLFSVPMFCLKSVTDIVDAPPGTASTPEQFLENLGKATHALHDVVPKVLEFMSGKTTADL